MKYFNRIFAGLSLAFACMAIASAGSLPRSPKQTFITPYSLAGSSVAISSLALSSSPVLMSGAVYQVVLSSGANAEYIVLVDTNTCTGVGVNTSFTAPAKQVGTRLFYSSTSANTTFAFDPPLFFEQGLCVMDTAVTGQAAITFEIGRGLSGN